MLLYKAYTVLCQQDGWEVEEAKRKHERQAERVRRGLLRKQALALDMALKAPSSLLRFKIELFASIPSHCTHFQEESNFVMKLASAGMQCPGRPLIHLQNVAGASPRRFTRSRRIVKKRAIRRVCGLHFRLKARRVHDNRDGIRTQPTTMRGLQ
jgi:hypothetical protein